MTQTTDNRVIEVATEAHRPEAINRGISELKDALDQGWVILSEVAASNRIIYAVGKPVTSS